MFFLFLLNNHYKQQTNKKIKTSDNLKKQPCCEQAWLIKSRGSCACVCVCVCVCVCEGVCRQFAWSLTVK